VIYQKASAADRIGRQEPMTLDTIFDSHRSQGGGDDDERDEAGRGRRDPAERSRLDYVPGSSATTSQHHHRHLMTHTSGLRPIVDLADEWTGYDTAIAARDRGSPARAPGERFVYSDINYFPARRHRAARERPAARSVRARDIFEPLG
jgi:hypothetical protein